MREPLPKRYKLIIRVVLTIIVCSMLLYFFLARIDTFKNGFLAFLSILAPFLAGALIAFLLKPLCNRLDILLGNWFVNHVFKKRIASGKTTEKRVHRRAEALSIVIAMIVFALIVIGIIMLIIPSLIGSIISLRNDLPGYINRLDAYMHQLGEEGGPFKTFIYDAYTKIYDVIKNSTGSLIDKVIQNYNELISTAMKVISTLLSFLVNILITVVSTVYILAHRKRFAAQANMIVRASFKKTIADWLVKEGKFTDQKFSEYFSGKLLDSFLVGIILFIFLSIFKIPMAPLIAVFMAFCNMIPFFGPYIGAIPCIIIVWMSEPDLARPVHVITYLIIVVVIQQLDGNILDPYIVGDKVGLSGFWVLFAVVLCGDLFGFVGLLIGVPLFVVIYDMIRQLIAFGLRKRGEEQLLVDYNFIYHDDEEEKTARKKRTAALRAARRKARDKAQAEQQEAMERELAVAQAAAAARAEAAAEVEARRLAEEAATAAEAGDTTAEDAADAPATATDAETETDANGEGAAIAVAVTEDATTGADAPDGK